MKTVRDVLRDWELAHSLGRRPATVRFNREVVAALMRAGPEWLEQPPAALEATALLRWAGRVAHYCGARWNAMVSALRAVSPQARVLPRRRLGLRETMPPEPAQWTALLAACDRRAPRSAVGLVVRFLAYTGLRWSEARALTWSEVRADRLVVPARVAKGGRTRAVPLHPALAQTLAGLRRLTQDTVDGAWRTAPILPRAVPRRALRAAAREAGLRGVTFHTLRHWYATRAIEAGVDLPTVARWLGHADGGALLARTYFHLAPAHDRSAAARLGRAWAAGA